MTTLAPAPEKTEAFFRFINRPFRQIDYFGPAELKTTFGVDVPSPKVPALFSESVLDRARRMDCLLVLQHDKTVNGRPLTMRNLDNSRHSSTECSTEAFYATDTIRPGLFLKSRKIIPGSTNETFIGESLIAAKFVEKLFADELPEEYGKAIEELRTRADELNQTLTIYDDELARQSVSLAFSRYFRETSIEVMYRMALWHRIKGKCLFKRMYVRTNDQLSNGHIVTIGNDHLNGNVGIQGWYTWPLGENQGFSFSCSGELEDVG